MPDDARILELVENALCLNLSAEEVCANNPELLAEVRDCLEECRHVDRMVENMFPSSATPAILGAQSQPGGPLPEIPGYEVLAVLGRGGHGIVYRARHLKLKRVAALKMLLTGEYASPSELAGSRGRRRRCFRRSDRRESRFCLKTAQNRSRCQERRRELG